MFFEFTFLIYLTIIFRKTRGFNFGSINSLYIMIIELFVLFFWIKFIKFLRIILNYLFWTFTLVWWTVLYDSISAPLSMDKHRNHLTVGYSAVLDILEDFEGGHGVGGWNGWWNMAFSIVDSSLNTRKYGSWKILIF